MEFSYSFYVIRMSASIHVASDPHMCWIQQSSPSRCSQSSGEKTRRPCIQGDDCEDEGRGRVPMGTPLWEHHTQVRAAGRASRWREHLSGGLKRHRSKSGKKEMEGNSGERK